MSARQGFGRLRHFHAVARSRAPKADRPLVGWPLPRSVGNHGRLALQRNLRPLAGGQPDELVPGRRVVAACSASSSAAAAAACSCAACSCASFCATYSDSCCATPCVACAWNARGTLTSRASDTAEPDGAVSSSVAALFLRSSSRSLSASSRVMMGKTGTASATYRSCCVRQVVSFLCILLVAKAGTTSANRNAFHCRDAVDILGHGRVWGRLLLVARRLRVTVGHTVAHADKLAINDETRRCTACQHGAHPIADERLRQNAGVVHCRHGSSVCARRRGAVAVASTTVHPTRVLRARLSRDARRAEANVKASAN